MRTSLSPVPMPPALPASASSSPPPRVAGQREHAADDHGGAGDRARRRSAPAARSGAPAGVAASSAAGDDLRAVERGLHLVDVGRRRSDDRRAPAQQVRRVGRPAQRDRRRRRSRREARRRLSMVATTSVPSPSWTMSRRSEPWKMTFSTTPLRLRAVVAEPVVATQPLGPEHHRDRIAGLGECRAADLDGHCRCRGGRSARPSSTASSVPGQQVGRADESGDEDARRRGVDLLAACRSARPGRGSSPRSGRSS